MNDNKVSNIVCSACFCEFFHNIISSVYPMRVGEHKTHFLQEQNGLQEIQGIKVDKRTFENCSSFELGSLEVVTTILGSRIPAREYSLSICVDGSTFKILRAHSESRETTNTHRLVLHQKQGPSLARKHLSSALSEELYQRQVHP